MSHSPKPSALPIPSYPQNAKDVFPTVGALGDVSPRLSALERSATGAPGCRGPSSEVSEGASIEIPPHDPSLPTSGSVPPIPRWTRAGFCNFRMLSASHQGAAAAQKWGEDSAL